MEHRPSGRGRDSRCRRHRWGTDPRGQLIQEAGVLPNPELIAEAVNVVVSICRTKTGGRVEEVAAVKGWSAGDGFHIARLA
jgi:type IV secretion system protein VirB11